MVGWIDRRISIFKIYNLSICYMSLQSVVLNMMYKLSLKCCKLLQHAQCDPSSTRG